MSARIDVCNFALALLGESEIVSLEDETDKARTMKTFYYIARDAVLESADWTFATRRFLPAKSETSPAWGWANAFPIPSDIIRVTMVDRNNNFSIIPQGDMVENPVDHQIEGNEILCNDNVIYCKGVRRMEDEGGYSPLFVEAFAAKLAYLAALPITSSRGTKKDMLDLHTGLIKDAKIRDGIQNTTRRMRNTHLLDAR